MSAKTVYIKSINDIPSRLRNRVLAVLDKSQIEERYLLFVLMYLHDRGEHELARELTAELEGRELQ